VERIWRHAQAIYTDTVQMGGVLRGVSDDVATGRRMWDRVTQLLPGQPPRPGRENWKTTTAQAPCAKRSLGR